MKYIYTLVLLFPCFIFSQPPGNGMVFDGNSDYYTVNDNSSIDMNGSFTIEAWINPCDTLGHKMILSKQWCNGSLSSYYFSFLNGKLKWFWNNNGVCGVSSGGNSYESTGNIIRNNIWQHVAVVHTPTSITFYYNGVAVAGGLVSGLYGGILFNSSEPLRVGTYRRNSGSYDFFLNGRIDEVRFWNTALSSSQILSRFNTSLAGNETSLQLYHNFESISGLVINNSCTATGAVNNGTNTIGLVSGKLS